ncbi:MAG TPA: hypothetical protein VKA46_24170 [Gemmataceae bacterium]|nr:hypothetical protein [Gemmataceae bacterium]
MSDVPIPSREDGRQAFNEVLAQYDGPAYLRRARRVQAAYDQLLDECRRQRDEWLAMSRLRLGMLRALAGGWETLAPHLADEGQTQYLGQLWALLDPRLRVPVAPTTSAGVLRDALRDLTESLERFNNRWLPFVRGLDFTALNAERADYNRYYLLEKECAVRSPHIARAGYKPLDPLTADDVLAVFPPLPIPSPRPPQ